MLHAMAIPAAMSLSISGRAPVVAKYIDTPRKIKSIVIKTAFVLNSFSFGYLGERTLNKQIGTIVQITVVEAMVNQANTTSLLLGDDSVAVVVAVVVVDDITCGPYQLFCLSQC